MIKVTRTMNNSLIVGNTTETKGKISIDTPFAMIPMEEGIRLIPLDIDLIGVKMDSIELTTDKVMYSIKPSQLIIDEYNKLISEPEVQDETN